MGGKRKNMPKAKRKALAGRGAVGKTAVAGAKNRATNRVNAATVATADSATLQGFIRGNAATGAKVYTDDAAAYRGQMASVVAGLVGKRLMYRDLVA